MPWCICCGMLWNVPPTFYLPIIWAIVFSYSSTIFLWGDVHYQEYSNSSQTQTTDSFLPHLTDFLPAGFKLYLPVVGFQLFRDDLERDVHWGQIKESLKRSKDLRLCTSSLMRVSTACFSASLMQMESRTWLPVFTTSLPVDMVFTLQVSSYCWGKWLHVQHSTWYILTKSASFTQVDTHLLVTQQY